MHPLARDALLIGLLALALPLLPRPAPVVEPAAGPDVVLEGAGLSCTRQPVPGGVAGIGDSLTSGRSRVEAGVLARDSWLHEAVCAGRLPWSGTAARPDRTAAQVLEQVDEVLAQAPRVVVVTLGANDLLHGLPTGPVLERVAVICARLRAAGVRPVLGTLPPFGPSVPAFTRELRRTAARLGVPVIDFGGALLENGRYGDGLARDGLHPSLAGARRMADAAVPALLWELSR